MSEESATLLNKQYEEDRVVSHVESPAWHHLSVQALFEDDRPRLDVLRRHFQREGRLSCEAASALVNKATELLKKEPNILTIQPPLIVFGDLHGQFFDLLNIMDQLPNPSEHTYLFLGDYVDRGLFSSETVLYLLAYKICFPERILLLRGNHECRLLSDHFHFKIECTKKYNMEIFEMIIDLFDALPIAATVDTDLGKYFCVHGGLSPAIQTLEDLTALNRFAEPGRTGALCDLLWSDPITEETAYDLDAADMAEWYTLEFVRNPDRGCGYVFGYTAVNAFLSKNSLRTIIRGHEVQPEGFQENHMKRIDRNGVPMIITVFSAPNYCDMYNNLGAILMLAKDGSYEMKKFTCVPHPYVLPNLMDAFSFSLPNLIENITGLFENILNLVDDTQANDPPSLEGSRVERIRKKVRTMARLRMTYKTMREEKESLVKINNLATTGKLSMSLEGIKGGTVYERIKFWDKKNEQIPEPKKEK